MDVARVRLVFASLTPRSARQAVIALHHSLVLTHGWQEVPEKRGGWEPEGDVATFHYTKDGNEAMMKALQMDDQLVFHFQIGGRDVKTVECKVHTIVNGGTDCADPDRCLSLDAFAAATSFVDTVFPRPPAARRADDDEERGGRGVGRLGGDSQPNPDVPPSMLRPPQTQPPASIYDIGRSDIDPNLGMYSQPTPPGHGMFMGPDHPLFQGGVPDTDVRTGFPPGSVPPGARFDPVTPFADPRDPAGRGRGRGRGRGGGGLAFGEPNPDHFRPPRGFDPFM
ncbi:hypothetical protein PTSG_10724 [Salpingoeca rosetta]|uniref:PI31 proteasome regulator C-terminal domain-containing protein n=1 Tax=Salpingoeca rosetta (strain ATCC 50818 / BSB-021) TaxID=946362 RepID=F2UQ73_SALR5|nr:uncharacterized protein PTSG_10724 [Salpingoeca rosetta]EGD79741.1 hypothetical protein PTSG_10724 [Salpingoeca rosetta]|eukprot:XP_004988690.1 hypothetical protein PTSG_10724 [Salpingoeca rosetta]